MASESKSGETFFSLDKTLRDLFNDVIGFCEKLPVYEEPPVKVLPEGKDDDSAAAGGAGGAGAAATAGADEADETDEADEADETDEVDSDEEAEKIALPECLVLFTKDGVPREEIIKFCADLFNTIKVEMGWNNDQLNESLYDLVHSSSDFNQKYSRLFSFFVTISFKTTDNDIIKVPLYYLQNNKGEFYSTLMTTMVYDDAFDEGINSSLPMSTISTVQLKYYIELCRMRKIHTFINEKGRGVVSEVFNAFHSEYGFEFVSDMLNTLDTLQDVPKEKTFFENERESALHGVTAWLASVMKAQGFGSKDLTNDVEITRTNFYPGVTDFAESAEDVAKECDVGDDVIEYLAGVPDDELNDVLCNDPLAGMRAEKAAKAAAEAEAAGGVDDEAGAAAEAEADSDSDPPPFKVARIEESA